MKRISLPLDKEQAGQLQAGDEVLLSGPVFTARDATHVRILEELHESGELPYELGGQIIMYAGPSPARANRVLGSVGPTTSKRMDRAAVELIAAGLAGTFGKGDRSDSVIQAHKEQGAVYFAAVGGIAALLAEKVTKAEVIAYPELGPEALIKLELVDFPAFVALDSKGQDFYALGPAEWRAKNCQDGKAVSAPASAPDKDSNFSSKLPGIFITIEGGEGAGKSTQIQKLAQRLESAGEEVLLLREPGDTKLGEEIRALLLHSEDGEVSPLAELLLYEAARAQLIEEKIEPALARGITVISDRFFDSTTAYQGYGRGLDLEMIKKLNAIASKNLSPDRTIYLAAEADLGLKRAHCVSEPDRLERAGLSFHDRVSEGFKAIACEEPARVRLISAQGTIEEVFSQVLEEVADLFPHIQFGDS